MARRASSEPTGYLSVILLWAEKNPWVSGMPGEKRVRKPLAFEDRNPGEVLFWELFFLHFLWYFVSVNFLVSVIQKWSSELANVAQKWANTCRKGHNPGRSSREFGSVGENIYRRTGIYNAFKRILCVCLCVSQICFLSFSLSLCFPFRSDQAHANDVVKAWYIEKRQYDFGSNSCSGVCGHYTQVNPTFD